MSKALLAILVLLSLTLAVFPQEQRPGRDQEDVLVSKDKPTVYITFQRVGERKPLYPGESNQVVWLRLHNNTRWAINFCTPGLYVGTKITPLRLSDGRGVIGLRDGVEVSMCHGIEVVDRYETERTPGGEVTINKPVEVPNPPVGYNTGDMFSSSWLPPGYTVVFSVPREHLAKHLAVYISFNYEWEYGERTFRSDEPQHRVYFRASDIPENSVSKKTKKDCQR